MIKKVGLAVSLGLVSSFSMADNSYDFTGGGLFLLEEGVYTGYSNNISVTTGVTGRFVDEFIFTIPEGFFWEVDFLATANTSSVSEFFSISFGDEVGTFGTWYDDFEYVYATNNIESFGRGTGGIASSQSSFYDLAGTPPGTYALLVSGNSVDPSGSYSVSMSLSTVSPVPEPSSIALMLGGLGLVGFMAARRRKQS